MRETYYHTLYYEEQHKNFNTQYHKSFDLKEKVVWGVRLQVQRFLSFLLKFDRLLLVVKCVVKCNM